MEKSNKKDKFDTEALKEVITGMMDGFDKEHIESPMFQHIVDNGEYLDDPDNIYTMITHPFERCLELAIAATQKQKREVTNLWLDFSFLERNVSQLCSKLYGGGCSVDRGHFIIKSYIGFIKTGIMPKINWAREYTYHYPETGTLKQWFDFVFGVSRLKYGYNEEYLAAFYELIKAHEKSKSNDCDKPCDYNDKGCCKNCKKYAPNVFLEEKDGTIVNIWNPKLAERAKDMPRIDTSSKHEKSQKK